MARKPKELPHLRVRIDTGLLSRLEKAREKNGRTLTGEIVHRLEQSFEKEDQAELIQAAATAAATATMDQIKIVGFDVLAKSVKKESGK